MIAVIGASCQRLRSLLRLAARINDAVGHTTAWLLLALVLTTLSVAALRYGLDWGSIALQETIVYLHATVFMLGAAFTLRHNAHVRVDVVYQQLGPRARAWIDLVGTLLLLLPTATVIIVYAFDYVASAWSLKEGSREAGGLPFVYVLKTLIPVSAGLLLLEGLAMVDRAVERLRPIPSP